MPTPTLDPDSYDLSDRYRAVEGTVVLTGIQALARIPVEQLRRDASAGLRTAAFLSGYPGSPLGGLDLEIARARSVVPELPIVHEPAVNEELGATAVMGSQLAAARPDATHDGVVGFWYGKAPGLDRAGDALRHGVFAGSSPHGGAVVLVGDDPACKSSTMPSSSDATLVDLHMPILYPGTVAECVELGLHAVAMSRATGLWSAMKIVTPVADGSGTVRLPVLDEAPIIPSVEVDGEVWHCRPSAHFLGPRMLELEREFREIRLPLAQRYGTENRLNRVTVDPTDGWIGLVATGFTYIELLEALRRLGLENDEQIEAAGIRLLQLRMPVGFDRELVRSFARGLEEIVVVEEKNPTLEWLVKDALYGGADHPRVVGKTHEDGRTLMRSWDRLDADAIVPGLRERLAVRIGDRLRPERAARERELIPLTVGRAPFFCSGCPHNWGTKVPEDALVGAGTGCHGMTLLMDPARVGEGIGITAMGNEGAQWIGMEPFVAADHLFQNYGDGTFFHSGQLAVQNCIAAGKNVTFKILYNGTVAMTGGQDSPSAVGVPELCTILLAHGAAKVAVTADDPARYRGVQLPSGVKVHHRTEIVAVQEDLRSVGGVTVLIHDQYCAAELRRDRRRGRAATPTRRIAINHRICEGCGDCGDVSNCLSVQPIDTPLGRKTTIDQESCNLDASCLHGDCPAFMTVEPGSDHGRLESGGPMPDVTALGDPPDPITAAARIRLAGIGGTGVVTVAQILATAAMFDGWETHGLDQTGLSQKAGPVVSDIVLTRPGDRSSNLVGAAQADVILGFDALVAASDRVLSASDPGRTVVVASSSPTPTGTMISSPEIPYPGDAIRSRLDRSGRTDDGHYWADARRLAEHLTGSPATANVFLLGAAAQLGAVPVSPASVRRAIELNGVAVDANLRALDWGRLWAADPERVEEIAASTGGPDPTEVVTVPELPASLEARIDRSVPEPAVDVVRLLAADLVGYQDAAYGDRFLDVVVQVAERERSIDGDSVELTETVARSLHHLMAYKDEYEVARLLLLPEAGATAQDIAGPDATVTWHLHPPMLSALGWDSKIRIGSWAAPAFRALRAGKRLRGTRLDPFGRAELRRTERDLVDEFIAVVDEIVSTVEAATLADAIAIAGLPDRVRGYEELKRRRIAEYRIELADGLAAMRSDRSGPRLPAR